MANTPNFDTEKLRNEALQLRDAVAVHAGRVAVKATELAEQGIDWAAPRAQAALNEAIDRATPVVEDVTARAVDAADRARPAFEKAREEVVEDYIPRIQRAVHEGGAALAAEGTPLLERARHAGSSHHPDKEGHREETPLPPRHRMDRPCNNRRRRRLRALEA